MHALGVGIVHFEGTIPHHNILKVNQRVDHLKRFTVAFVCVVVELCRDSVRWVRTDIPDARRTQLPTDTRTRPVILRPVAHNRLDIGAPCMGLQELLVNGLCLS
eukprot:1999880-Rhodomonas_salina.1